MQCQADSTYTLRNLSGQPVTALVRVEGSYVSAPEVRGVDASKIRVRASNEREEFGEGEGAAPWAVVVELQWAAGETKSFGVRGRLRELAGYHGCLFHSTNERRHFVVSRWSEPTSALLKYEASTNLSTKGPPSVVFRLPKTWKLDGGREAPSWRRGSGHHPTVPRSSDSTRVLIRAPRHFDRGGPLVSSGLEFFDHRVAFHLGAGWEVTAPNWISTALVLEGTVRRRFGIAVTSMFHRPSYLPFLSLLPSLAAGVGLPIDLWPRLRVGTRFAVSLNWHFAAIVARLDVFSARELRDRMWRAAVLLRLSI